MSGGGRPELPKALYDLPVYEERIKNYDGFRDYNKIIEEHRLLAIDGIVSPPAETVGI